LSQLTGLHGSRAERCPNLDYAKERDQIAPHNSTIYRSIQRRIAGVVSSVSGSSSARISATRGVDVVRAVWDRIWLVVIPLPRQPVGQYCRQPVDRASDRRR